MRPLSAISLRLLIALALCCRITVEDCALLVSSVLPTRSGSCTLRQPTLLNSASLWGGSSSGLCCPGKLLVLRGAGEDSDQALQLEFFKGLKDEFEDDYDKVSVLDPRAPRYFPGNEDAPPHPSEVGWDADWYTKRGIDLSQGMLRSRGENGIARDETEISDREINEFCDKLDRIGNNETALEEEVERVMSKDAESEDDEEEEEAEEGVEEKEERERDSESQDASAPTLAPDDDGKVSEEERARLVDMPVDEMRAKHWGAMTDEQTAERFINVLRAFHRNETSHLYDLAFVQQGNSTQERMNRLFVSAMGLEPAVETIAVIRRRFIGAPMRELDMLLMMAVMDGDPKQAGFWIRRGANVNAVDSRLHRNYTALHHAATYGHASTIQELIKHGADVLVAEPKEGRTALHIAALRGHTRSVQVLVRDGQTPVDVVTRRGRTPLHDACARGQTDTARTLLDLGADVNRRYQGVTTEVLSVLTDMPELIEDGYVGPGGETRYVAEGVKQVRRGSQYANSAASALHDAAEWGFEVTCRMLLRRGARLHLLDADGNTPLERTRRRMTEGDPDEVRTTTVKLLRAWEEGEEGWDDEDEGVEEDTSDLYKEAEEKEFAAGTGYEDSEEQEEEESEARVHVSEKTTQATEQAQPRQPLKTRQRGASEGRRDRDQVSRALHPEAGRIMMDCVWEDGENYNGHPLTEAQRNGTAWVYSGGFRMLKRDVKVGRKVMAGRRKPGLDNPGLTPNYGSEIRTRVQVFDELLEHFLWPKADMVAVHDYRTRHLRRAQLKGEQLERERLLRPGLEGRELSLPYD